MYPQTYPIIPRPPPNPKAVEDPREKDRVSDREIAHAAALAGNELRSLGREEGVSPEERRALDSVAYNKKEAPVISRLEAQSFRKVEEINGVGISVKWKDKSLSYGEGEGYYELYVFNPELDKKNSEEVRILKEKEKERDLEEEEQREISQGTVDDFRKMIKDSKSEDAKSLNEWIMAKHQAIVAKIDAERAERAERKRRAELDEKGQNEFYLQASTIELGTDPKKAEQVYEYARASALYARKDVTLARRRYDLFQVTSAFADGLLYNTELKEKEREMIKERTEQTREMEKLKKLSLMANKQTE